MEYMKMCQISKSMGTTYTIPAVMKLPGSTPREDCQGHLSETDVWINLL